LAKDPQEYRQAPGTIANSEHRESGSHERRKIMGNEAQQSDAEKWKTPIPKAVQAQVEQGEKALKEMQEGTLVVKETEDGERVAEASPADETKEPEEKVHKDDEGTWEHRYNVLKGKYDTEIRELRAANASGNAKIVSLTETIANLNDLLVSRQSQGSQGDDGESRPVKRSTGAELLDREKYSAYGEEIEEIVDVVNDLKKENAELKSAEARRRAEIERESMERFKVELDKACPGWREADVDPDFFEVWLGSKYDSAKDEWPYISPTHQKLIDANRARDTKAVADIFNLYLATRGRKPSKSEHESETSPLEDQVVPDVGTGAGIASGTKPRRTITDEAYSKAVQDKIKGRITEAEFDAIARDYHLTKQRQAAGRKK
jgi:hypothetical protein